MDPGSIFRGVHIQYDTGTEQVRQLIAYALCSFSTEEFLWLAVVTSPTAIVAEGMAAS